MTTGFFSRANVDAWILGTDPLSIIQGGNPGFPAAGGTRHYLFPQLNWGSVLNGHSIDHIIEALSPNSSWENIKRALTPPTMLH